MKATLAELLAIVNQLDGCGLVVTDWEEVKAALKVEGYTNTPGDPEEENATLYILSRQDVRDVLEQCQTDGEPGENFLGVVLTEEHYRRAQKFIEADFADRWFEDIRDALEEVERENRKAGTK